MVFTSFGDIDNVVEMAYDFGYRPSIVNIRKYLKETGITDTLNHYKVKIYREKEPKDIIFIDFYYREYFKTRITLERESTNG